MSIDRDVQSAAPGELVTMFELDCTAFGGDVYRFCPCAASDESDPAQPPVRGPVTFGGLVYTPAPCEAIGFEWNGRGPLPTPKFRLGNVGGLVTAILIAAGSDLLGARFTRLRTFSQYLDGAPEADPDQHFPPDRLRLDRKSAQTPEYVEWELAPWSTYEGKMLPRRQALRDYCSRTYRRYDPATGFFDYAGVQCPYDGVHHFDAKGNPTTADKDQCGKRLRDCALRFSGRAEGLPTWAFPGMTRVR